MKILITVISILFFSVNLFAQVDSPMDKYEREMKTEYKLHKLHEIVFIVQESVKHGKMKNEFKIGKGVYKMKAKSIGKLAERDEAYSVVVKHLHREYNFNITADNIEIRSNNLSFFAKYDLEKNEIMFKSAWKGQTLDEIKIYAYNYNYNTTGELTAMESFCIRDNKLKW